MLEQILRDMYIDPELLAELDEEQKQILFFKMRQEQVRRWKVWQTEAEAEKRDPFAPAKPRRPGNRKVNFLNDVDGKPKITLIAENLFENVTQHVETAEHSADDSESVVRTEETLEEDKSEDLTAAAALPESSSPTESLDQQIVTEELKETEQAWQVQLRQSKRHDEHRRAMAEAVRKSADESTYAQVEVIRSLENVKAGPKPQPQPSSEQSHCWSAKPSCQEDIITWFHQVERKRGAGVNPSTGKMSKWFHGMISRDDAEDQLRGKWHGSFLVRLSDKIWGYVISYRCLVAQNAPTAAHFKHFLVDASDAGYHLFGAEDFVHRTLNDLVQYHSLNPLSLAGQETLRFPCGQVGPVPDYHDLFDDSSSTSSS